MRADRLEDRTAENVATASTSVPTAVANDETTTQSTTGRTMPGHFDRGHVRRAPGIAYGIHESLTS